MNEFFVENFARATLRGARSVQGGKPLTPQQVERVIACLWDGSIILTEK